MTEYAGRLQSGADSIEKVRMFDTLGVAPAGQLQGRAGFRPDGGGDVTVTPGSMNVNVSAFLGWVDGSTSLTQAGYPFANPTDKTITLRDGDTSERVDTIVARVWDTSFDNSGLTKAEVYAVEGTPGVGPAVLPPTCLPLRDVTVRAGVSAGTGGLVNADLGADRRTYTSSLGGVVHVHDSAERDQLDTATTVCWRLDLQRLEARDGSGGWQPVQIGVDTVEDTGWQPMVNYKNGFGRGGLDPEARRIGNHVQLRGRVAIGTYNGVNTVMCEVPSGMGPSGNHPWYLCHVGVGWSGAVPVRVSSNRELNVTQFPAIGTWVNNDGEVSLYGISYYTD